MDKQAAAPLKTRPIPGSQAVISRLFLMLFLVLLLGLIPFVRGAGTTVAATYTTRNLVVAQDGSGQYSTVQSAVNAVPANNTTPTVIYIKDGTYNEVVTVPSNKPYITFAGQDQGKTIISYNNYSGKSMPGGGTYDTANSATVFIEATDFLAVNLTIQNTAGDVGQAVAADVEGDRANFYNVTFKGWQDTLLAWMGRQYYDNVHVYGRTDYIFGDATAYFNNCQLYNLNGWGITAQYRQNPGETTGYVFNNCSITGTPANSTILGRPWGPYARVIYLNCSMDSSIVPAGWANWTGTNYYQTAYFAEYNSSGAGADPSARVSWSYQLTSAQAAQYSVNNFINQDGWLNSAESFLNWLLSNYPTATPTPTPTPTFTPTPIHTPTPTPTSTPTPIHTPTPTPTSTPTPIHTPTPTPTSTPTPIHTPTPTPTSTPTATPIPTSTPTPTPTVTTGASASVSYVVTSQWTGGFGASITITNTGPTTINSWTLVFSFAAGQQVTQGWNGTFSQSGSQVTVTNASYNGSIAPGASVNIGFNGSWTTSNPDPGSFTLNGQPATLV